jgi:hypothetical protein
MYVSKNADIIAFNFADVGLTRIETEKGISIIKAWEDSEKSKAENK